MAVETKERSGATKTFAKTEVESKLRELLLEAVTSDAELKSIALPADPQGKSAAAIHIDSLGVVDLLCGVEKVVGVQLKESLVKAGGYMSINEAIGHLMPRIEKTWIKNASGGKE
jgi:hypothetical protein